jgi:hypothetical protein
MYVHARRVPVNCNTIPFFRQLFHHHHTLLTRVLGIMLCPLRYTFIMIYGIVVVCVVQLAIAQKAQLWAAVPKVMVPVVHIAKACHAPIMWLWAHVGIMPLTMTQDAVAPLGAFFVDMISAVLLALTTIEPLLTLALSVVVRMFVALLLGYASNGGVINEGGTNSTMITPCRSSNVAIVGTVVVMSLVTSLYGVINMATIVCGS